MRPTQAVDLDTDTLKSSTATVILYACRLASRIDNYVSLLLDYDAGRCGTHNPAS